MSKINFQEIKKLLPEIKKNVLLKNYTTFKIGGRAKYFFEAKNKEDLIKAISLAKKFKLPFFILGGGSNLLVSDKGFKGLVIKIQNTKYKIQNTKIMAEVGVMLGELVNVSAKTGLSGLEWAVGIPGTVGGAIHGNAGAFGKSMKNVVKEVEVFDLSNEKIKTFKNKDCQFDYRESIFKKNKNLIILSTKLKLKKEKKSKIERKMREYLNYRKENQHLNLPSAGSVFKNYELRLQPAHHPPEKSGPIKNYELVKEFPELREFNKKNLIPAAWLIEKCGLKGKKIGGAKISEKHANFIVNLGEAKAEDVKKLINLAKKKVKNKFSITLEEEIQFLGF